MPRVHRQIVVPTVTRAMPHDPGGEISGLHVKAMSIVFGAQFLRPADPSNAQYVGAVERAIGLMEDARQCWLWRNDLDSAGRASAALSAFAFELDRVGDALRWMARAQKELGPEFGPEHEDQVAHNFLVILLHVEEEFNKALQQAALQAWRGVRASK
jgi:hypothetical protein